MATDATQKTPPTTADELLLRKTGSANMPIATLTVERPLTAADLLRMDAEGLRGELIRGVFCETMPPGKIHAIIVGNLGFFLKAFVRPRRLGIVAPSEMGVLIERDPDTVRAPDIAFFSVEQDPPGVEIQPGYSQNVPALVVEVGSPNDRLSAMREKALMWLAHGARMVWNVHPNTRTVDVYRPNRPVVTLTEDDELGGYDVLPGFACKMSEVFEIYYDANA